MTIEKRHIHPLHIHPILKTLSDEVTYINGYPEENKHLYDIYLLNVIVIEIEPWQLYKLATEAIPHHC